MKITNFLILNSHGDEVSGDAHGNNLAFICEECGHPVLVTALKNQRGNDVDHPAKCKGCGEEYFIDPRKRSEKLYIFTVTENQ